MAEEIEIRIVADDTELINSFQNIAGQAEELSGTIAETGESIGAGLSAGGLDSLTEGLEDAGGAAVGASKGIGKASGSMSKFTRIGGRGASMLGRFGGKSGMVIGRLGSMTAALAGTPLGAFALAATAAAAAISFFSKSVDTKKILELEDGIRDLTNEIKDLEAQAELIELDVTGATEREKFLKRQVILQDAVNKAAQDFGQAQAAIFVQEQRLQALRATGAESEEILTERKFLKELKKEKEEARIKELQAKLQLKKDELDEQKRKENLVQKEIERREKVNKLFNKLITDERQKAIQAATDQAAAREKEGKEIIKNRTQLTQFLIDNENFKIEQIKKINAEFDAAEAEARKGIQAQLITDAEELEKFEAALRSEKLIKDIQASKESAEVIAEQTATAQDNLNKELAAISDKFAEERKQKEIDENSELLAIKAAQAENLLQADISTLEAKQALQFAEFAEIKRTDEEIAQFEKQQQNELTRLTLEGEKKRLEIIRDFNKQITEEEKAALNAQIKAVKAQIDNIGVTVQKASEDAKGEGLGGLLGLNKEQGEKANQAAAEILQKSTELVRNAINERINILQEEIDFRESRIDNLNTELSNEIKLNELGKASNIENVKAQLEAEKAAREKAQNERQEAARAAFLLDSAVQASSLAVTIANLYKSLSPLGGVGILLATTLTGVLLSSFVAGKAKAAEAAGFAEGGYTGRSRTGSRYEPAGIVHKGEFVIDKPTTEALGLQNKSMKDFKNLMLGEAVTDKNNAIHAKINQNNSNLEAINRQLYKDAVKDAILSQNGLLNDIKKAIKEQPVVIPVGDGRAIIERYINNRKIKEIFKFKK